MDTTQKYKYGIVVKRCDMLSWPTSDVIGYSPSDADDENEISAMVVNEPFLIVQECTIDGKEYYWGMSDNCTGWVSADDIALCKDADEWLAAWEFDVDGKDFLVVTQDKITLEESYSNAYSSKVLLDLGCALPLVPESEWDEATQDLAERGTWNNYVVYIPTKAEDGSYVRRCALISEHYKVSIGYDKDGRLYLYDIMNIKKETLHWMPGAGKRGINFFEPTMTLMAKKYINADMVLRIMMGR